MMDFQALTQAVGELEEDKVEELLEKVMAEGGADAQKALEACQKGMDIVGKKFEEGYYYVGDLIYAGELMTDAVDILKDALVSEVEDGSKTKIILCTVKDDLHDIGKNIVRAMLKAGGFDVIDLGVDTPAEKIVAAIKEQDIKIVALSGVLTLAVNSMKEAVHAIKDAGLTDVKILIGGAPVSEQACVFTGADAYAHNPQNGVNICREWAAAM